MRRPVEPDAHLLVQRLHQRDLAVLVAGPELRLEPSQRRILRPLGQPVQQLHRLGELRDIVAPEGQSGPGPVQVDLDQPGVVATVGQVEQRLRDRLVCLGRIAEPGGVQACELVGHPSQCLRRCGQVLPAQATTARAPTVLGPSPPARPSGSAPWRRSAHPRTRVPRPASTSAWACDRVDDLRHHASARGGVQRNAQRCVVLDDDQVMAATALPHSALDEPHRACHVVAAGVGLDDHRRPGRRVCEQSLDQRRQHLGVGPAVPGGALRAVDQQGGRLAQRSQRAPCEQTEWRCTGAHSNQIRGHRGGHPGVRISFRQAAHQPRRSQMQRLANLRSRRQAAPVRRDRHAVDRVPPAAARVHASRRSRSRSMRQRRPTLRPRTSIPFSTAGFR